MTDNILLELRHPTDANAPHLFILLPTAECSQVMPTYNQLSDAEKRTGLSVNKATLPSNEHWEVDSTCALNGGGTTPTPETAILRLASSALYQIDLPGSTTPPPDPDPTPTPTPTLGSPTVQEAVGISATEVRIQYTLPSGANRLGIQRRLNPSAGWTTVQAATAGENHLGQPYYVDGGLSANTRYYYQIRAINDSGAFGPWLDVIGTNNNEIRTTA